MQCIPPYSATTTMISGNQVLITGGQFTQHHYHGQKVAMDKLTGAIAVNAFHDSAARFDPPKCHPRTRVRILDDIMCWIIGQGKDIPIKPFLWLNGAAGARKSAIAQSTVERCMERGLHVASFFFSKSDPTRNRAEQALVATLAYQLYQAFPGTEVQTEIINKRTKGSKLDQSWPAEWVIDKLAKKSSGQFIYAATVIRYVESTRHRPDHRLDIVFNLRQSHNGDHPFAKLDELYAMILQSCSDIEKVLEVLSLLLLEVVVSENKDGSVNEIEKVLAYEKGEVERLFCDLGALVQLSQPPKSTLKILHASLYDYLLDKARSKQFHIDLRGKYFSRHMANLLKYLVSCLDYDPYNWHPSLTTRTVISFINNSSELRSCTILPELRQAAFSFSLQEFAVLYLLSTGKNYDALDFVAAFLHVLRIMALTDPTYSYIEDHQRRNLDTVMIHSLQRYFGDDRLALVLVLFCHLGSDRFVPWCDMQSTFRAFGNMLPELTFSRVLLDNVDAFSIDDDDNLRLTTLWIPGDIWQPGVLGEAQFTYFDYMRGFLRNVSAPSPAVYTKAARVCFDALQSLPVPRFFWKRNAVADGTEDDPCPYLVLNDKHFSDPWIFRISSWNVVPEQRVGLGAVYYTVLGYLIFFLPRCGRSDDLIAACTKRQTLYIEKPNSPFPIRWRRLHEEINSYLARVLPTSNV
ncbi:hypothetical protein D9613_011995 [Agrocybe pediades]|uniref:Nephrocystin 3-like N-terminal domain-containing protein n=1 Tax=Agrocybe pediades TaxID=84607 RepID=A0A8H4VHD4_9AGAR|nr:hypothetical protein D9613_011995 [Agrocybe pediades]